MAGKIQTAVQNRQMQNTPQQQSVNQLMNSILDGEKLRGRFNELLGKRAPQFVSALVSMVNADQNLQQAFYEAPMTVIQSALKAATFDLPIDQNLGYVSLVRFAGRFREIDKEFYGSGDIEYSMDDARRRLAQMGITISGDIALAKNTGNYTRRQMEVKHNIAQATQGAGICATIAANDVWGWAEKRIRPVLDLAQEHMARYAREGEGFLLEYLEKLGFLIVDGHAVGFVDENDNPVRQKVEGL